MFFQGWDGILRTVIVGALAYVYLVGALRVSGKRTLAKLNAFDLVVTIAIGSTLATILLSKTVALAEGMVALALLIGLQFLVAFLSVRWPAFARAVRSEPTLLVRNGELLRDAMRRTRVTADELRTVARTAGHEGFDGIAAVVLESDGSFSVIEASGDGSGGSHGEAAT
ncbi:DUF421 domain-containing protein [Rhodobacterales bacterium HKCCE2091]|nr:DUF421 domain-containing protein [Rhodobacterales bacterium HKCCE2091]